MKPTTSTLQKEIANLIHQYESPKRVALSKRYPFLKRPILFTRQNYTKLKNTLNPKVKHTVSQDFYSCIVARHQSVLRRQLGDSDPELQEQKIINIKQAIQKLNGIIIQPNQIFSLWTIIGKPDVKKGYVNGMLLSNGRIVEGLGGGLCQLSNFLYWIFLHTPIKTIQRYHHSMDVFPDSGRTLPFGGGATILYNFVDLKVQNISNQPLQLKIWLTDKHLKGQILAPNPIPEKFHIYQKQHYFIKRGDKYFRYNQIYRDTKTQGKIIRTEKVTTNFAPVLYQVTPNYIQQNQFEVLDFTKP